MDRAIQGVRRKFSGTYIDNAETLTYVLRFDSNWEEIQREFHSKKINIKTEKIIIMSMFTGSSEYGHWLKLLLRKTPSNWKIFTIDSLKIIIHANHKISKQEISKIFPHITIAWNICPCIPKCEFELSPRTIHHIYSMAKNIHHGETLSNAFYQISSSLYYPQETNIYTMSLLVNLANHYQTPKKIDQSKNFTTSKRVKTGNENKTKNLTQPKQHPIRNVYIQKTL